MTLRSAHIVLIAAAIFLGAALLVYGVNRYSAEDEVSGMILAGAGAATDIALLAYLRYFIRKTRNS